MISRLIITGTDTGVGKTVFSAAITNALNASYWKPIQSGLSEETDSETVHRLGQIPKHRIFPEAWRLESPLSPHLAAEIDGVTIDPAGLQIPETTTPLVIEGAGGLLVPVNRYQVFADLFAKWQSPVVLCSRTALGTINHTLLSLEALRQRQIPILGIAFIGDSVPDTEKTIIEMGGVPKLGRLPRLDPLTPETLFKAFKEHFDIPFLRQESAHAE